MSDRDKYRRYAEKIRIFNGLTPEEVSDILHQGQVIQFRQGDTIFHEGSLGSNLFIVLSGQCAIYSKDKEIARCQVGDAFGEMAVLNHKPRCATAAALSDVTVFTLDEAQINSILKKHVDDVEQDSDRHVLSERLESNNEFIAKKHLRA